MSNFETHVKRDTVKWVLTLVGFILVAVVLVGIICGWFTKKEAPMPEDTPTETGSLELYDTDEESGIALMSTMIPRANYAAAGIASTALDAVTVSVKSPVSGITYKWALSMSSGTPSTYITLSGEEGTSVDVTCKAAFSNVITLTCSETFQDQVFSTATCTLNYFKRVASVSLNGVTLTSSGTFDLAKTYSGSETNFKEIVKTATLTFTETMSAGTTGTAGDYYGVIGFTCAVEDFAYNVQVDRRANGTINVPLADFMGRIAWAYTRGNLGQLLGISSLDNYIAGLKAGTLNDTAYQATFALFQQAQAKIAFTVGKGTDVAMGQGDFQVGKDNIFSVNSITVTVPSTWKVPTAPVALDKSNIEF